MTKKYQILGLDVHAEPNLEDLTVSADSSPKVLLMGGEIKRTAGVSNRTILRRLF